MKNVETAFAEQLLEVKAIKLQPENPLHGQVDGNHLSIAITARRSLIRLCAPLSRKISPR